MTDFEFVFILYGLILGLSLAAILSGLGRALEFEFATDASAKDSDFVIGSLTPLMAVFVMLDLMSFWMFAWAVRNYIEVNPPTLVSVAAFASGYFLTARLVFPERPETFKNLNAHYFRTSRTIYGILIAMVVTQWIYLASISELRDAIFSFQPIALTLLLISLMAIAIIWRNRHVQAVILVALIVRYLVLYFLV